jgi:hypothetical protein
MIVKIEIIREEILLDQMIENTNLNISTEIIATDNDFNSMENEKLVTNLNIMKKVIEFPQSLYKF